MSGIVAGDPRWAMLQVMQSDQLGGSIVESMSSEAEIRGRVAATALQPKVKKDDFLPVCPPADSSGTWHGSRLCLAPTPRPHLRQ